MDVSIIKITEYLMAITKSNQITAITSHQKNKSHINESELVEAPKTAKSLEYNLITGLSRDMNLPRKPFSMKSGYTLYAQPSITLHKSATIRSSLDTL